MLVIIIVILLLIVGYYLKVKSDYKNLEKTRELIKEFLSVKKYYIIKNRISLSDIREYDQKMQTDDFFIFAVKANYGREREKFYIIDEYLKNKMLFAACSLQTTFLFENNNNEWVFYSDLGKCCYMIIPSDSKYGQLILKTVKERYKSKLKEITQEEIEKIAGNSIDYTTD